MVLVLILHFNSINLHFNCLLNEFGLCLAKLFMFDVNVAPINNRNLSHETQRRVLLGQHFDSLEFLLRHLFFNSHFFKKCLSPLLCAFPFDAFLVY